MVFNPEDDAGHWLSIGRNKEGAYEAVYSQRVGMEFSPELVANGFTLFDYRKTGEGELGEIIESRNVELASRRELSEIVYNHLAKYKGDLVIQNGNEEDSLQPLHGSEFMLLDQHLEGHHHYEDKRILVPLSYVLFQDMPSHQDSLGYQE